MATDDWTRPYPRQLGAFPVADQRADRYFPPVGRIDGAYGDRNVFCTCPALLADLPDGRTEAGRRSLHRRSGEWGRLTKGA